MKEIDTRLVYGFLEAGKTTYIKEIIRDDRFYKYGSTLIICFEEGEEEYDEEALEEKRANVVYFNRKKAENNAASKSGNVDNADSAGNADNAGNVDNVDNVGSADNAGNIDSAAIIDHTSDASESEITRFCRESIDAYQPDRIYVEMNIMMQDLREYFPDNMRITFSAALIDWSTMPVYYVNFMQMIKQMVSESNQVTFRGCPSSELLAPYGQAFRLMNPKALYLRQDPMGYHEKAFGLFLPFSIEDSDIVINEKSYLPLWLDALDYPEHYDGKRIHFTDPVELRRKDENSSWTCGRVVMTCCMADLQFMSFELEAGDVQIRANHVRAEQVCTERKGSAEPEFFSPDDGSGYRSDTGSGTGAILESGTESILESGAKSGAADSMDLASGSWVTIDASAKVVSNSYGQRKLMLVPDMICQADPPEELIFDGRRQDQESK